MDESLIKKYLSKILDSESFHSDIDKNLLRYLVESSIQGSPPKEITIAIEIFQRTADFDPSHDSIVRNHIYMIRKKLKTYYLTDGKNDEIQFIIPKGNYKVNFVSTEQNKWFEKIHRRYSIIPFIFIALFIVFSFYLFKSNQLLHKQFGPDLQTYRKSLIWSDFLQSDLPTLIVIGDYYFTHEPREFNNRERFIRDVEINSDSNLSDYLEHHPEDKSRLQETPLTYLGSEVPESLWNLYHVFKFSKTHVKIKIASKLIWDDLQQNNIIFIGHFKTLGMMNHFYDELHYKYKLFPHALFYTESGSDSTKTISLDSYYRQGFHNDFAIVAKMRGTADNTILLINSFSSFGKIEAVKKLIDPLIENELREISHPDKRPVHFELLFRIYGVESTGFETEIMQFDEL